VGATQTSRLRREGRTGLSFGGFKFSVLVFVFGIPGA
jgi:hypothetical protein